MRTHVDKNTPRIEIRGIVIALVEPIAAQAAGWIDETNADACIKLHRVVMVRTYGDNKFDYVCGYLDRDFAL